MQVVTGLVGSTVGMEPLITNVLQVTLGCKELIPHMTMVEKIACFNSNVARLVDRMYLLLQLITTTMVGMIHSHSVLDILTFYEDLVGNMTMEKKIDNLIFHTDIK